MASLRRGRPDWEALLGAVGAVWTAGVPIDWRAVDAPHRRRRAELPTYPFQRTRLWLPDLLADLLAGPVPGGCDGPGGSAHLDSPGAPLLGHRLPEDAGLPGRHVWQRRLTGDHTALLADHRSQGQVVMPGVGYVEMAMAAARELAPGRELAAQDVEYLAVLALPPQTARTVQVTLQAEPGASDNGLEFTVHSRPAGGEPGAGWLLHAAGRLVTSGDTADDSTVPDAAGAGVSGAGVSGASTTGASTARAGG